MTNGSLTLERGSAQQANAIEVKNLKKRLGDVDAVDGISFTVAHGELFGLLGPNGAGKTTTINMLTGLARPDHGTFRIAGIDCTQTPRAAQGLIGVVPDESNLYAELTGFENLCFCAALYGLGRDDREARARRLLAELGLAEAGDRKFGAYSKGMKRKLAFGAGVIHEPRILFLDEPTTGIDVASARQLRERIADLHARATTIFLTTHYIEEAERLCDRIAFIVSGRIVRTDRVEDLLQPIEGRHVVQISSPVALEGLMDALRESFPHLDCALVSRGVLRVEADTPVPVGPLVRFLEDHGAEVSEARRMRLSLEDVFVRVTGIEAEAMRKEKEKEKAGGPR
jgi:ABC-2 type transport system ATP-binding protein